MHARVTLTRVVRQYCDIVFRDVESLEDAERQINDAVTDPLSRARLLRSASWYPGDEPAEEMPGVAEIVESHTGVI